MPKNSNRYSTSKGVLTWILWNHVSSQNKEYTLANTSLPQYAFMSALKADNIRPHEVTWNTTTHIIQTTNLPSTLQILLCLHKQLKIRILIIWRWHNKYTASNENNTYICNFSLVKQGFKFWYLILWKITNKYMRWDFLNLDCNLEWQFNTLMLSIFSNTKIKI